MAGSSFGLNCLVANPPLDAVRYIDKYLWEGSQVFLTWSDLLSLRETSRFHSTCEWSGLGWTVVLSPLVHVLRRRRLGTTFDDIRHALLVLVVQCCSWPWRCS